MFGRTFGATGRCARPQHAQVARTQRARALLRPLPPAQLASPAYRTRCCCRSVLHGLLRKLGAGFEDMLPSGMSGVRIKVRSQRAALKQRVAAHSSNTTRQR